MNNRYVILAHTVNGPAHFDLLLEGALGEDERLKTFQLDQQLSHTGDSCPYRELTPHRTMYLDYEGAVSGNRGFVRRAEAGCWYAGDDGAIVLKPENRPKYILRFDNDAEDLITRCVRLDAPGA